MPVFAPLAIADEQPSQDAFKRLVGMFAGAVGRGRIDKVVLARRVGMRSPVELDVANALRRLAVSAPESTTYAFRRDGRTFLGATPERLVRTEGRTFRTVAVAGTIRRGASPEEDAELGRRLLASEKDREEHAIVVDAIRGLLTPVADTLDGGAGARRDDAALRPAPRDGDLGDGPRRQRPARAGRAPPPDAGGRRRSARRRARAHRRARGLRPRLVRGTRSAGWARTATASCASRCAAGSSTGPGRPCSRAAGSSPTPTRTRSGRSRGSSCGR